MRPLPDKVSCSCLMQRCGMTSLDAPAIIAAIRQLVPPGTDFDTMSKPRFREIYKQATNQMARESAHYKALTPAMQQEMELSFIIRCGGCGFNVLSTLRQQQLAGAAA